MIAGRPASSARPRVLCHVVHYFGRSAFVGRSTTGEAEHRRAIVQRALAGLRALPVDLDLHVFGIPGHALVEVDRSPDRSVDPRLLVYESIQQMAREPLEHDWYLTVEDDVLLESDYLQRAMDFERESEINEVLHPNRLEQGADGRTYCVDLEAMPGWRGLERSWRGQRLDVAENPHSALISLSRQQLAYAADRVDFARREHFVGGYMESAFANVHQAFLLWRPRSELTFHTVAHLDAWLGGDVAVQSASAVPEPALPDHDFERWPGHVDDLLDDGQTYLIRGWALPPSGRAFPPEAVLVGGQRIGVVEVVVESRPDVMAALGRSEVDGPCGFALRLDRTSAGSLSQMWLVFAGDSDRPGLVPIPAIPT